jgi:hypothetical protein
VLFNELHVRKNMWELKVLDQKVSVAMDRMNVSRALYSRQTYKDAQQSVENMVTTKYNDTVLQNDATIDAI